MNYQNIDNHWNKFSSTLAILLSGNRRNLVVIALLATESFFRPALHRILELLFWMYLDFFARPRRNSVSIGISQVQIIHWETAGIVSASMPRLLKLAIYCNPLKNYDVCEYFLKVNQLHTAKSENILKIYTGNTTSYHRMVFQRYLTHAYKLQPKFYPLS